MDSLCARHYYNLELPKVFDMLAKHCSCADSAQRAREIEPICALESVQHLMGETVAAYLLIAKFSSPSFGGITNIDSALSRAASGGSLSAGELLNVCGVLRIIRSLSEWKSHHAEGENRLDSYFSALYPNKYLEEKISQAIISEEEISDRASPALYDILP